MRTFQVELSVQNSDGEQEFLPIFYVMGETAGAVRANVATIVGRRIMTWNIIESPVVNHVKPEIEAEAIRNMCSDRVIEDFHAPV